MLPLGQGGPICVHEPTAACAPELAMVRVIRFWWHSGECPTPPSLGPPSLGQQRKLDGPYSSLATAPLGRPVRSAWLPSLVHCMRPNLDTPPAPQNQQLYSQLSHQVRPASRLPRHALHSLRMPCAVWTITQHVA